MNHQSFSPSNHPDKRSIRNRVLLMLLLTFILSTVLVMRLHTLQVKDYERYSTRSEDNRIHSCPIAPTRGVIYDVNGEILAGNVTSFNLVVLRHKIRNDEKLFEEVKKYVDLSDDEIAHFKRKKDYVGLCDFVILKSRLSDIEIAVLSANRPFLKGVEIEASLIRNYPFNEYFAHSVGYIGSRNDRDNKRIDENLATKQYIGTKIIGKTGLEKEYEPLLLGAPGNMIAEVNSNGRIIRELNREHPKTGKNLHLFLDSKVQLTALNELENSRLKIEKKAQAQERARFEKDPSKPFREIHVPNIKGAIVAIDVKTGGIVAMISNPSFDPNPFVTGYGFKAYQVLSESKDKPFLNRASRGTYAPASTIKPFIGLGAVDKGFVSWDKKFNSTGFYELKNGNSKKDWKKGGHGLIDLQQAITESVNTYFYDVAYRMKLEPIHETLANFGLGQVTAHDIYADLPGLNPSRQWKKDNRKQSWYPGDTVNLGIGQGYFLVSPMQMAIATTIMARKGKWFSPRLVDYYVEADGTVITVSPPPAREDYVLNDQRNWDKMHKAMEQVIYNSKGTAKIINTKDLKYRIAGKTGTGQNVSLSDESHYIDTQIGSKTRDNAWFVSFAPADNPRLAIAIILENSDHGGSVAAPIARKMFDAYLLNENGQLKDFSTIDEVEPQINIQMENEQIHEGVAGE
ncbi:MAG: penicillin-binding protein 2 [Saccharospirillaceae bacterium]|nr:penicillin-binding protein 2 [Pseudomonadales bacterium]NRB78129.1 penicillin-binding protein 2 [Saccharospirillaceae bacterium]